MAKITTAGSFWRSFSGATGSTRARGTGHGRRPDWPLAAARDRDGRQSFGGMEEAEPVTPPSVGPLPGGAQRQMSSVSVPAGVGLKSVGYGNGPDWLCMSRNMPPDNRERSSLADIYSLALAATSTTSGAHQRDRSRIDRVTVGRRDGFEWHVPPLKGPNSLVKYGEAGLPPEGSRFDHAAASPTPPDSAPASALNATASGADPPVRFVATEQSRCRRASNIEEGLTSPSPGHSGSP